MSQLSRWGRCRGGPYRMAQEDNAGGFTAIPGKLEKLLLFANATAKCRQTFLTGEDDDGEETAQAAASDGADRAEGAGRLVAAGGRDGRGRGAEAQRLRHRRREPPDARARRAGAGGVGARLMR